MKVPSVPSRRAFTLIELLVVISIIAILMTLLFPAVGSAINAAKKTQAKNDATQIATAINAFMSEYGKLPTDATGDINASQTTSTIMDALCPPTPSSPPALNPRGITFLEIPKAKNGKNGREDGGAYLDPWGQAYFISMDGDYDGVVKGPSGTGASEDIRKTAIVWSKGDPNRIKDYASPEKWIKSWE
jgi:prepilin-type N-terminal cleavage/methylation domain-containing protein